MNAEQAKAVASAMAGLWQSEVAATVRVMSAMSDAQRDFKPHDKSRSGWDIAVHIATSDVWFVDCISEGKFSFDPEKAKQAEASFGSVADIVAFYEQSFPAKLAALTANSGEFLNESVDFFGMMQQSRAGWIGFANNHSVHHRGQLSAYLRSMGCKVPDIYGKSADSVS
jgi:uncharacterized damage-inducible protein DinB